MTFAFIVTACRGSMIDSGYIYAQSPSGLGPIPWIASIESSAGGYQVSAAVHQGLEFAECPPVCVTVPFGATIVVRTPWMSDTGGGTGSAVIGETSYPSVVLSRLFGAAPFAITADPVTIAGPGRYTVPFSMTGFLDVSDSSGQLLWEPVWGSGTLGFSAFSSDGVNFMLGRMDFTFSVPEPAACLPCGGALFLCAWLRKTRGRLKNRVDSI